MEIRDRLGIKNALQNLTDVPDKPKAVLPTLLTTKAEFLALDKVGSPTLRWLEIRDLEFSPHAGSGVCSSKDAATGKFQLAYDEEWLAITRACASELQPILI